MYFDYSKLAEAKKKNNKQATETDTNAVFRPTQQSGNSKFLQLVAERTTLAITRSVLDHLLNQSLIVSLAPGIEGLTTSFIILTTFEIVKLNEKGLATKRTSQ